MFRMIIAGCMLLGGCSYDVANRYYAEEHYPPKPIDEVAILYHEPSRPYETIAELQARNDSDEGMQKRAAEIGADAVIVQHLGGRYSPREEWAEQKRPSSKLYTRIVGIAIKYKE